MKYKVILKETYNVFGTVEAENKSDAEEKILRGGMVSKDYEHTREDDEILEIKEISSE
tara:strand:- start:962 stop:1135 length:174 start_codon:yes stop_codon:yes gene_type:complete